MSNLTAKDVSAACDEMVRLQDKVAELERTVSAMDGVLSEIVALLHKYRIQHKDCIDLTGHPDALKSMAKDWRCELCREADILFCPPSGCTDAPPIPRCQQCGLSKIPRISTDCDHKFHRRA